MRTGDLLELLGFSQIGEVVDQRMVYSDAAPQRSGKGNAVYVFVNSDDTVWKVGMTRRGFSRTDYSGVLDGRKMKRPNEQRKLELIRAELHDGATSGCDPLRMIPHCSKIY